jgi:hypothetical protein
MHAEQDKNVSHSFGHIMLLIVAWLLMPFLLPLVLAVFILCLLFGLLLQAMIWLIWLPQGRDTLVVYSDSPHWKQFFEDAFLPLVAQRSYVLNWSRRNAWRRFCLPVLALRYFGGRNEFNPLLVLFRPFRPARTFRLWKAFQDHKHGKSEKLDEALDKIAQELRLRRSDMIVSQESA